MHFIINFSPDENNELFDSLLSKKSGINNHIRLSDDKSNNFLSHCKTLANSNETHLSQMSSFFKIITYIDEGTTSYTVNHTTLNIPENLKNILDYINKNYASINTVKEISEKFYISISTLERLLKKYLSMTPKRYLEDKKLQQACILLKTTQSYRCLF